MKLVEELSKIFIMIVLCVVSFHYYSVSEDRGREIDELQNSLTWYHMNKLADMDQLNDDSFEEVKARIFPLAETQNRRNQ